MNRHEETDIDALAQEYDYLELTEGQRHVVIEALGSEEAYTRYRHTLLRAREEMSTDRAGAPASHIRRDLHEAMRRRRQSAAPARSSLSTLLTFRIPAWQAGLGMAALAAVMMLTTARQEPSASRVVERIVQIPAPASATSPAATSIDREALAQQIADSIIEKVRAEMRAERPYNGKRPARVRQRAGRESTRDTLPQGVEVARSFEPVRQSDNRFVGLANLPQLASQKRGKSLAEDSAFTRFTVSMRRDTF